MLKNRHSFRTALHNIVAFFSRTGRSAKTAQRRAVKIKKRGNAAWTQAVKGLNMRLVYLLTFITNLTFLVFGILFILYSNQLAHDDTQRVVQITANQIKYAMEEHISEQFSSLSVAAMTMEKATPIDAEKEIQDETEVLHKLIHALRAYNSFVTVGFADTQEKAVWLDKYGRRHNADLKERRFVEQALAGENVITPVRWDAVSGMYVNIYSVPVYHNGTCEVKGVLFANDAADNIRNLVNNSLYAGHGLAHIIDSKGDYVIASTSPLSLGLADSIFAVPTPIPAPVTKEILKNLTARQAGQFIYTFKGQKRLIAYVPLSINDWFVFYVVPENLVNAGLKRVTTVAIAIIIMAMLMFSSFFLLLGHISNRARKALEKVTFSDPVTGGSNYSKFMLDAEKALRKSEHSDYAVSYMDIRGFRYINDLFGRQAGDRLLRYWHNFLKEITRKDEFFGRVNSDIFVALIRYQSRHEIEKRFASIAHRLAVYPEMWASGYKIDLCGGIYLVGDYNEQLSFNDMLDRAITAQKEAKALGGTQLLFYSDEMRLQKLWEAEVEANMEAALENNEFKIFLQPKIDIQQDNRIMGAEALVRWIPPGKDPIPPAKFIPLFERNGFIVKLDRFVLELACRHYRENVLEGVVQPYVLSVNVSKLSLMQPDFCEAYAGIKQQYSVPDGALELEFTESMVFENHTRLQNIIEDCKRNGFICSLDDFGAGYSSLNLLKSLAIDVLKLDRLFFQYGSNPERGRELVRNIVTMAKALGMKIVAEGIDESEQVAQLRQMGCDAIQGYIFAPPMPLDEFAEFCGAWEHKCVDDPKAGMC